MVSQRGSFSEGGGGVRRTATYLVDALESHVGGCVGGCCGAVLRSPCEVDVGEVEADGWVPVGEIKRCRSGASLQGEVVTEFLQSRHLKGLPDEATYPRDNATIQRVGGSRYE